MNKLARSSLAACFLLTACGSREALNVSAGSCHVENGKASIVSPEGQTVWKSIGNVIRAKTTKAKNPDGYEQDITVDLKSNTCIVGNPQSDGRLIYAIQNTPSFN